MYRSDFYKIEESNRKVFEAETDAKVAIIPIDYV
jgi:hypothetical protein